jgi:hypothetical protein
LGIKRFRQWCIFKTPCPNIVGATCELASRASRHEERIQWSQVFLQPENIQTLTAMKGKGLKAVDNTPCKYCTNGIEEVPEYA